MVKKILIINSAEPEITGFYKSIEQILERYNTKYKSIEYKDCPNVNFDMYDGVIITGSPQGDDIVEHHAPYFKWIKDFTKPVLGICAGHHIIGWIYGSEILRGKEPETGIFDVKILIDDPILNGIFSPFKVMQMHNDSITLPDGFIQLATSSTCKNQLIKHKNKPIYTCQFHPEYYTHSLFDNFINLC